MNSLSTYENELEKLQLEEQISDIQKNQILHEMKELQSFCCLGLKSDGNIECFIHERVFSKLLEDVGEMSLNFQHFANFACGSC